MARMITTALGLAIFSVGCDDKDDSEHLEPVDTAISQPADPDDDGDGYTIANGDCDDEDPLVNPGQSETCNDLDDDCDGTVDEDALDASTWYADQDGDGYLDREHSALTCDLPVGFAADDGSGLEDCDDANAVVHPGAEELCNGMDDDCDGAVDEDLGIATTCLSG